ncbi:MAG: hypothetical protein RL120_09215, partial [Gammaproteobacteria bacterium]
MNLQGLGQASPPKTVLAGVLEQTIDKATASGHGSKFFSSLLRRPRFSLEASFIGTLVWVSTFGLPQEFGFANRAEAAISGSVRIAEVLEVAEGNINRGWTRLSPLLHATVSGVADMGAKSVEWGRDSSIRVRERINALVTQ